MRRSGKTTRLIDEIIQRLFTTKQCYVPKRLISDTEARGFPKDEPFYYDSDFIEGNKAQKDLINRLLKRLDYEHKGQFEIENNSKMLILKLRNNEPTTR